MKVGIVIRNMETSGGTQRTALELARHLKGCRHDVTIYAYRYNPSRCYPEMSKDISIRALEIAGEKEKSCARSNFLESKQYSSNSVARWIPGVIQAVFRKIKKLYRNFCRIQTRKQAGKRICQLIDPSTDVLNGIDNLTNEILVEFKRNCNHKVVTVWTCTDLPRCFQIGIYGSNHPRPEPDRPRRITGNLPEQLWEKRMARGVDLIVVHARKNEQLVRQLLGRTSELIRPGVDIETIRFLPQHLRSFKPFRIASAAVFFRYRRFEDLLHAVALLRQRYDVELEIAGTSKYAPNYEQELHQLATDLGIDSIVNWRGWVSEAELRDLYARTNAFVWCNHNQSWGCAVFEAMACGTPVVVSRTAGASEVLTNGVNALVVPPLDPGALAGALEKLIINPSLRSQLAERARTLVEGMTWTKHARRNVELFQMLYEQQLSNRRSL